MESLKIINGKHLHNELKSIITEDGIDFTDKIEIADYFAHHSTSVSKKLAEKITPTSTMNQQTTRIPNSIFIEQPPMRYKKI